MEFSQLSPYIGLRSQRFPLILLPALAFGIPLFVGGPQWLTGTLVNALLVTAVLTLGVRSSLSIVVFPSIAALLHGVLFGPATPFLLFFLPAIWVSNAVFVVGFSSMKATASPSVALGCAAFFKSLLLFGIATLFLRFGLVPAFFVTSMGVLQFITAVLGGLLAFLLLPLWKKLS